MFFAANLWRRSLTYGVWPIGRRISCVPSVVLFRVSGREGEDMELEAPTASAFEADARTAREAATDTTKASATSIRTETGTWAQREGRPARPKGRLRGKACSLFCRPAREWFSVKKAGGGPGDRCRPSSSHAPALTASTSLVGQSTRGGRPPVPAGGTRPSSCGKTCQGGDPGDNAVRVAGPP